MDNVSNTGVEIAMPYVDRTVRKALDNGIMEVSSAGELNYCMTKLALRYLELKGESYQTHAEIISAFEGAKLEWYRKKTAIYEDKKCAANGEVYE